MTEQLHNALFETAINTVHEGLLGLMCFFFRIRNVIEKINKSNKKKEEAKRFKRGKISTEDDAKWGRMHMQ